MENFGGKLQILRPKDKLHQQPGFKAFCRCSVRTVDEVAVQALIPYEQHGLRKDLMVIALVRGLLRTNRYLDVMLSMLEEEVV